ncbi:MAG: gliding motility-associated C-terminal domain-containing protein [Saprospiraceae bacterium]
MNVDIYGIGFGPDTLLYGKGSSNIIDSISRTIYLINTSTNVCTPVFTSPLNLPEPMNAFLAMGNGIFYTMMWQSDALYRWDVNAGTVTIVGHTGYPEWSDMCTSNGNAYYISRNFTPPNVGASLIHLDLSNPANSSAIGIFDNEYGIFGITASSDPRYLLGTETWLANGADLYKISLIDAELTLVCSHFNGGAWDGAWDDISSPLEHGILPSSDPYIDLDCDDSSGATDQDYNAIPFDCLKTGVHVCDFDIVIESNSPIDEVTLEINSPTPDGTNEILDLSGTLTGITAIGLGTSFIRLINQGTATRLNFREAIKLIVYSDHANPVTEGTRIIEVQFTSMNGQQSNVARAYIEVNALPPTPVDLGPDAQSCAGDTLTISGGPASFMYQWSTGDTSNAINVTTSDTYLVTISSTIGCPAEDQIDIEFLPVIHVWLKGDSVVCEDHLMQLVVTTDAPFPIDVLINSDPGQPILLEQVSGEMHYSDLLYQTTEFTITSVLPSEDACVEVPDPEQVIELWPNVPETLENISLCFGDSIFLGSNYHHLAGVYPLMLSSIHGCDSLVTYTVTILPAEHIYMQAVTCDPALAGVVISYLPNANGCDTVIHTMFSLLAMDTNYVAVTSCRYTEVGVFTISLTNLVGCDSLIITTVSYSSPMDTTLVWLFTCDSSAITTTLDTFLNFGGCDSLVMTRVVIPPPDTSYQYFMSCDSSAIGMSEQWWSGVDGCDSLVITITSLVMNDTTFVFLTSCDSSTLGVFKEIYPIINNCDSVVIREIDFALADTTWLSSGACDPADTGIFITTLSNQYGCDSILITNITLLPSNTFSFNTTSCNPQDTGIFIQRLTNQFGCDSIITTLISLVPSNTIQLESTTCDAAQAGNFTTLLQNQFGCDSTVLLTIKFIKPDTMVQMLFTCESSETGTRETSYQNRYGCDSLVMEVTALYNLPTLQVTSLVDYNGFDISCFGSSDGQAGAEVTGTSPIHYLWSQGSDLGVIAGIPNGLYSVSISDANGCMTSGEITLTEPPLLEMNLFVSVPDCFESEMGMVQVEATGGVSPYVYSIDEINFSSQNIFDGLTSGAFTLSVRDANDCVTSEIIAIHIPFPVNVDLGQNQILNIGDSISITAMVNVPYNLLDSIKWTGLESSPCPTCLEQTVAPIITSAYSIQVINNDGCKAEDEVEVTVAKNDDVFVPNVFSPNGDGTNDVLLISAGSFVKSIVDFSVYDRWGNFVFHASNFQANQNQIAWDGNFQSTRLNSGVYTYRLVALLKDGKQTNRFGDITLLR